MTVMDVTVRNFIALDLETTGLAPAKDRIIEIGAVRVEDGREAGRFETLVDPGIHISPRITQLTGINDAMARTGMDTRAAVETLAEFCGGLPLLGHNIRFDYGFVKQNAVNFKIPFEKQGIDTLKIARRLLPDLESRGLGALCTYFGIPLEHAHRAGDDACAAYKLYFRLAEAFPEAESEIFAPKEMPYKCRRQGPVTPAQKRYLNDLAKYHKINLSMSIDALTKNEASRLIDKIISEYGRITR